MPRPRTHRNRTGTQPPERSRADRTQRPCGSAIGAARHPRVIGAFALRIAPACCGRAHAEGFINLLGLGRSADAGLQPESSEVAMTTTIPSADLAVSVEPLFTEAERIALAGILAAYSGLTRDAYSQDLRTLRLR